MQQAIGRSGTKQAYSPEEARVDHRGEGESDEATATTALTAIGRALTAIGLGAMC